MDEMDQMGRTSKMEGGSDVFLMSYCYVRMLVRMYLVAFIPRPALFAGLRVDVTSPFSAPISGSSTRSLAFLSSVERLVPGSETEVLSRTRKRKQNHPSIAQCAYGILASLLLPRNPAPIRQSLIPPAKDGISYVTGLRTGGSLDLVRTEIVSTWFQVELL